MPTAVTAHHTFTLGDARRCSLVKWGFSESQTIVDLRLTLPLVWKVASSLKAMLLMMPASCTCISVRMLQHCTLVAFCGGVMAWIIYKKIKNIKIWRMKSCNNQLLCVTITCMWYGCSSRSRDMMRHTEVWVNPVCRAHLLVDVDLSLNRHSSTTAWFTSDRADRGLPLLFLSSTDPVSTKFVHSLLIVGLLGGSRRNRSSNFSCTTDGTLNTSYQHTIILLSSRV